MIEFHLSSACFNSRKHLTWHIYQLIHQRPMLYNLFIQYTPLSLSPRASLVFYFMCVYVFFTIHNFFFTFTIFTLNILTSISRLNLTEHFFISSSLCYIRWMLVMIFFWWWSWSEIRLKVKKKKKNTKDGK